MTSDTHSSATSPSAGTTSRTAIVTGASGGIGAAVSARLGADGYAVVVHYSGNAERAEATVKQVRAAGGRAVAVRADIADEVAVAAMFDVAEQQFGGVDVVVNCAGSMKLATVVDADLAEVDAMHRTNIRGSFVIAQQAARRVRPGGAIITFSTSVIRLSPPTYAAYAASKGAVEAMTMILAREMRGKNVTVNAVAPGPTATALFTDGKSEQAIEGAAKANPLQRLGQPEDIAEVVAFLAGPGRWVNGQVVDANGGMA